MFRGNLSWAEKNKLGLTAGGTSDSRRLARLRTSLLTARLITGRLPNVRSFSVNKYMSVPFYRAMLCIRGTSHGPVSVRLSVTSRCSIETAERIELVFGT